MNYACIVQVYKVDHDFRKASLTNKGKEESCVRCSLTRAAVEHSFSDILSTF